MAPCPSGWNPEHLTKGQPYPSKNEKREPAGKLNQALVACKSDNLRGRDVQRLRQTSIHVYARDHIVLKGPDFEVRGNVSWTKVSFVGL